MGIDNHPYSVADTHLARVHFKSVGLTQRREKRVQVRFLTRDKTSDTECVHHAMIERKIAFPSRGKLLPWIGKTVVANKSRVFSG